MHGDGEYLSSENLQHGMKVLLGVVADVALKP